MSDAGADDNEPSAGELKPSAPACRNKHVDHRYSSETSHPDRSFATLCAGRNMVRSWIFNFKTVYLMSKFVRVAWLLKP